ncbi:MAG: hypothetical protein HYZ33_04700, partial [Ignavibacteriales bacterium]|nr:hypothetical protein [Ignavibacteriales bacterium]
MKIGNLGRMFFRLMLRKYSFFLFFGCAITVSSLFAQTAWQHLGVNEGLAQGYVGAIMQDSRGFLWFGTGDGLSRYDGYAFKNFRNDPNDSTTISTGIILALHECTSGLILVGFLPGNIDIYDPATEQFFHLRNIQWSPTILAQLFSIVEDTSGTHWVGRYKEVLEIRQLLNRGENIRSESFQVTSHREFHQDGGRHEPFSLSSELTVMTYSDRSGGVWVWSDERVHVLNRQLPKLPEFQKGARKLRLNNGNEIVEDNSGMMWFSISDSIRCTLYSFSPETGETKRIAINDTSFMYKTHPMLNVDTRGNLWLIGNHELIKLDP